MLSQTVGLNIVAYIKQDIILIKNAGHDNTLRIRNFKSRHHRKLNTMLQLPQNHKIFRKTRSHMPKNSLSKNIRNQFRNQYRNQSRN